MSDTAIAETLSASDVAAYLRRHPEFLSDYPELAAELTLPRDGGPVASLAVYQLQSLREKNAELERQLNILKSIAHENERLMQRVHDLNVAVLRATTFGHVWALRAVLVVVRVEFAARDDAGRPNPNAPPTP